MQLRQRQLFTTIRAEGAILPADLLQRVNARDGQLKGLSPEEYHLAGGLKLNEAISQSWNRMQGAWTVFQNGLRALGPGDTGTTLTREKWLLPLFQELGYGRLPIARGLDVEGKGQISHLWQQTPIHLVGARVDLDTRTPGVKGAARVSPHGLMQELLNRREEYLWGFVSNGLRLRILRDNVRLTRQAYVEFDLEAMMNGELYPDFALLWMFCHESRVNAEKPADCRLEAWSKAAHEQGARALEQLRIGVEEAIKALGRGFLAHPANQTLLGKLRAGALNKQDYFRQLLRLVYRMLFLFIAEDRDLLLAPEADETARERYARFYSLSRLRNLAERRVGSRHADQYHGLRLVMRKLGAAGCPELGLPPLGSFLFSGDAIADLDGCEISNSDLLDAVRALAFITDAHGRRKVDYLNLGSSELGSVYESLLELHPILNAEARRFELATAGGNERKTSGSYYTPESLVQCLLDSALDPVLAEAARRDDPETAILDLKVCDPACGSGHFLIAAAHRMAKRLAAIRTGDDEPAPEATRTALRDVIGRCLYGVDLNPMAVELCKVSLWMEALEPGKPLSFLDHHIRLGNSLIGATPALLKKGIPDKAFNPIEGDDKAACAEARRLNKKFRESGQRSIFEPPIKLGALAESVLQLEAIDDRTIEGVREKQRRWEQLVNSNDYIYGGLLADAWCAAFVWRKVADPGHPAPITEELFRKIEQSPWHVVRDHCFEEICRLSAQYQFFHWHLEFPKVFRSALDGEEAEKQQARWHGGFDVVLGNPPWERIKLQEKEWFAQRSPEIANAPNAAARQRKIRDLIDTDPDLHAAFLEDRRKSEGESHLARNGGRFPLCGVGDINTYAIFAETNRMLINERGRVGCILPSGIATDDTTKEFFQSIVEKSSLVSLYDFQSGPGLFGEIGHARFKFCLLTLTGPLRPQKDGAELAFFLRDVEHLRDADRSFRLSAEEIALLNPNTRTCPIFRSQRDSELTKAIYRRVPVLIREGKAKDDADENPWGIEFKRMIDMANDSGLFKTSSELLKEGWHLDGNIFRKETDSYLPLYEAKMLHHYTHRYGDYTDQPADSQNTSLPDVPVERLQRPEYVVQSRYWVPREDVIFKITRVPPDLLKAYRDGDEEGLRMAATRWLTGWENAHLSESDWEGLGAKERDAMRERRDRARRFLADYPLTRDDIAVLRRGREDLRDNVAALVEAKAPRWLLGWRDICRSTDERTVIASVLPLYGVGDKFLLMFPRHHPNLCATFLANMAAFAFDYCSRQKVGGTSLKYFTMRQLPVLPPSTYKQLCPWYLAQSLCEWIPPRVLELTYTAYDLRGFAEDCGYTGEPFRWDEARRFLLRCELDAAYFHLYGIGREDVDYILDTFPIVQRDDVKAHGEYRTKRVIMEIYDAMTEAIATGAPYRTRLEPPPANGWTPPARAKEEAIGEPPSSEDVSQGELFGWRKEDPQQSFRFGEEEG